MLYHLLYFFSDIFKISYVTKYITFRGIVALLSALLISFLFSPWFIRKLKNKQLGQVIRDEGPKSHLKKSGTPTMGGGLLVLAVVLSSLFWMDLKNHYMWYILIIFVGNALVGFYDDYMKITKKSSDGIRGKTKLFYQILISSVVVSIYYLDVQNTTIYFPFFKSVTLDLGIAYIPFAVFIIVGASNAVNLTDGLDGLAIGPVMISSACYIILCYVSGNIIMSEYLHYPYIQNSGELAIFAAAMVGAGMGFLWYNTYPAQVFMGDVGSLPLGAGLGALAVFSKHEILLAIIGGIFVLEAVSVITQVASFKLTGKRIFRMAPIHHHFELKGWPEPKVIVRFWIISIVLAMIGLLSLKLR